MPSCSSGSADFQMGGMYLNEPRSAAILFCQINRICCEHQARDYGLRYRFGEYIHAL
ncbi:hypothetical protein FOXYSP1_16763 [Fusarium oxysporum f. sp. phaseoli]